MTTKEVLNLIPERYSINAIVEWYESKWNDEITFAEHFCGREKILEKASYLDSSAHLYRIEPSLEMPIMDGRLCINLIYQK